MGQLRTGRQEQMARDFGSGQGVESGGILGVFPAFRTAGLGQNIRQLPPSVRPGAAPTKRKRGRFCAFLLHFPALVSLGGQNLTAIVGAASLASSVGLDGLTALGANTYAGSSQLPVGTTPLITTGLGHFTLRDSHG